MENLIRDLKYGTRSLLRDKGFATTVLLTLAVCIAANTTTFAIVNSVVLHPLPVPKANEIVLMANRYPKAGAGNLNTSSVGDYYDRLRSVTALGQQALFRPSDQTLEIGGTPRQVPGMAVTPSFFPLVGIAPELGRMFAAGEGEQGGEQKVILSDTLWRTLYGADLRAVGRELRIGGRPYTIVGVMPGGFNFVDPGVRFWIPLAFTPEEKAGHHSNNWYHIGRLKPGATPRQAQAQIDALNAANLERFPQLKAVLINAGFHTRVEPLQHMIVKDVEPVLYLLWGGAAFVLFIGALNLANVALARLTVRRKEIATRLALGAGRAQLFRQFVIENVVVALGGGIVGVLLGAALLRALTIIRFDRFPRASEVQIDGTVIAAALGMSALVGVLIGALPLINVIKLNVSSVLHEDSRTGTGGIRTRRLRQMLVGAQIGFAFVLLAGAGLLLASFRNLLGVNPGFTSDHVLTASTNAPRSRYPNDNTLRTLMNRALDSIRRLPGVVSAGATTAIPFGGDYGDAVIFAEGYVMQPGESLISPRRLAVTPGYFETMKIAVTRGRYFADYDNAPSLPVVIIDEKLARHFWPNRDPIGRRMYQPQDPSDLTKTDTNTRWFKVIGVVGSVRLEDLAGTGSPVGAYYFPYAQDPSHGYTFAIKTTIESSAVERAVRAQIAQIDPELALFDVRTMVERAELSLSSRRTSMMLALGFGTVAVFLSAIGVYGVLAYLVTQRRREIGIRIALGSTSAGVVKLVFREGLWLAATGFVLGLTGAVALHKAVASQIYGVQALDPVVIGSVIVLLGGRRAGCVRPACKTRSGSRSRNGFE
ncbi:MAG: ABC transporter permease [Bryobacteraceae bacterium]